MFLGAGALRSAATVTAALLTATGCGSSAGPPPARWRLTYVSASCDESVFDIAPVSANEGWAVGERGPGKGGGVSSFFLLHRNGGAWRPAELPLPPELSSNLDLDASGPGNVWLFGNQHAAKGTDTEGTPKALRWDGRGWRGIPVDFSVRDVAVLAPGNVWALEGLREDEFPSLTAHHWDGGRWTSYTLPHRANALSATGPEDLWAVGDTNNLAGGEIQPAISHFDGNTWRAVATPVFRSARQDEAASLTEVVAVSRNDAWAFGVDHVATDTRERNTGIALHWDGSRWRNASKLLDGVAGIKPPTEMLAARDGAGGFFLANTLHRTADGTRQVIKSPRPVADCSGKTDPRQSLLLSDLRLVPGTHEVWGAGVVGVDVASFTRGVIATVG